MHSGLTKKKKFDFGLFDDEGEEKQNNKNDCQFNKKQTS